MNKLSYFFFLSLSSLIIACGSDSGSEPQPPVVKGDLEDIPYSPTTYDLVIPTGFPQMDIPADNPMTQQGVELGHRLFFDEILSVDESISCSSCHLTKGAFTDNLALSPGVNGTLGTKSAMSILNTGFMNNGLFWDGRVSTLEEQAELPVEDPVEMHNSWPNVEDKFRQHSSYPRWFREAFGIKDRSEISKELAVKALAQYQRSLIAGYNSEFDRVIFLRQGFFSDSEQNGYDMFFDNKPDLPDAECGHCHNIPLFLADDYFNNGIDSVATLSDFEDIGRGKVTGKLSDYGKFRAPSLRNIALSAPYMHDGRFETLEEVLDHYNSGGHIADNLDPNIRPLGLTEKQKEEVISFLHTLTDTSYFEDPLFNEPEN